jgi:hypothetical protein
MNRLLLAAIATATLSAHGAAPAVAQAGGITDHNGAAGYLFAPAKTSAVIVAMHGGSGSALTFAADPEAQIFSRDMNTAHYAVLFLSSTWQIGTRAAFSMWCDPSGYSGNTVTNCNSNSPAGNNQDLYNIQQTLSALVTAGKIPSKLNVVLAGMSDGCFEAPNYALGWAAHRPANVGTVKAIVCQHEQNQSALTRAALPTVFVTSVNDIVMPSTSSATAPCCYKFIAPLSVAAFKSYATGYRPKGVLFDDPIRPLNASDLTQRISGLTTAEANTFIHCLQKPNLGGTSPWLSGSNWKLLPGGGPTSIFYDNATLFQGGWNEAAHPCGTASATLDRAVYHDAAAFDAGHQWVSFHDSDIIAFLHAQGL